MNLSRTLLATALTLGLAFAATAQTPTPTPTDPVTDPVAPTPTNHGQVVREAAQRDATGKPLTPPGQTVREVAHLQGDFMQLDGDKSGALSKTELNSDADLLANFDTLDEDGNGEISRIEFNSSIDMDDDTADSDDVEDEE
jgi:hypothetical protein